MAEHINAMKKKYEESDVKIQEIQSLIRGAEVWVDQWSTLFWRSGGGGP